MVDFGRLTTLLFGALALSIWSAAPAMAAQRGFDAAVLAEINYARTHPAEYAESLREFRGSGGRDRQDDNDDDRYAPASYEGYSAIDDAVRFLQLQRPLAPLAGNDGLRRSASGYAEEQGETGNIGHTGYDGSNLSDRVHRNGVWSGYAAEAISYGQESAAAVVRQLIIDDGVASRGHRKTLFDPGLKVAGVGCGPHRTYGYMCVIDFAGALVVR
jgi:hypothetical protein